MNEKILKNKKNGMAVLLLSVLLYAGAIALVIFGAILLENKNNLGAIPLAIGGVYVCLGWILWTGLKVIKPQEALVLTLFGKYIGTLKGEGFYFVNPFCTGGNAVEGNCGCGERKRSG